MKMKYDFLIIGAGFTGSVLAERLAKLNKKILIIDKRNHIGGNCYDYKKDGILIQKYGPHIFHTKDKKIFDYLSQFTNLNNYKHKVVSFYNGKYYPIPINLDTLNKFFNLNLNNEKQARDFLEKKKIILNEIKNSRDVIVSKVGKEIYEAFIRDYTKKQWDKFPEELDRLVLERLPIRYNKNPYYFDDEFQGMPVNGFTKIFEKMLNDKNIKMVLNTDFFKIKNKINYKKLIYTGPIDGFFNYKFGKLEYRCINFILETLNQESFQPNSVVNYPDKDTEFVRVTEFKKFYNINSNKTTICKEIFSWKGEPSYPVMNEENERLYEKYEKQTEKLKNVIFAGRLAHYKYFNMDQAIGEALKVYNGLD